MRLRCVCVRNRTGSGTAAWEHPKTGIRSDHNPSRQDSNGFWHALRVVRRRPHRRRDPGPIPRWAKCRLARAASVPHLAGVLEGRRVARGGSRGRKVRTPQGAGPRNSGQAGDTRGRSRRKAWPTDSATENKPPGSQGPGKGEKAVQETTARNARSGARQTSPGARPNREPVMRPASHRRKPVGFRVSVAQRNDSLPGANQEDRIRLTALPRHHPSPGWPPPGAPEPAPQFPARIWRTISKATSSAALAWAPLTLGS